MTPDDRPTLAAADHYERRARELRAFIAQQWPPHNVATLNSARHALDKLARARSAELLDPEPSPYTIERGTNA